jgi:hypothetical protein
MANLLMEGLYTATQQMQHSAPLTEHEPLPLHQPHQTLALYQKVHNQGRFEHTCIYCGFVTFRTHEKDMRVGIRRHYMVACKKNIALGGGRLMPKGLMLPAARPSNRKSGQSDARIERHKLTNKIANIRNAVGKTGVARWAEWGIVMSGKVHLVEVVTGQEVGIQMLWDALSGLVKNFYDLDYHDMVGLKDACESLGQSVKATALRELLENKNEDQFDIGEAQELIQVRV